MKPSASTRLYPFVLVAALGLAACGGGSGDTDNPNNIGYSGPTTPVAITSANAGSLADSAYSNVNSLGFDSSQFLGQLPTAAVSIQSASIPGPLAWLRGGLDLINKRTVENALVSAVMQQGTTSCPGGGAVDWSYTIATSGKLSSGDSYQLRFNNCVNGMGAGGTVNGSMRVSFASVTGDPANGLPYSLSGSVSLNQIVVSGSSGDFITDGGFQFEDSLGTDSIRWSRLSGSRYLFIGGGIQILFTDFDFSDETNTLSGDWTRTANYTLASNLVGGTITVRTIQPFQGNRSSFYPASGSLTITGANGTWLTLTAVDTTQVYLEWDIDGDGIADGNATVPWSELYGWTIP